MIWVCIALTALWLCSLKDEALVPLTTIMAVLAWVAYAFFAIVK